MAKILTPEFRISFPSLFEPNEFKGTLSYQCSMMFDKNKTGIDWLRSQMSAVMRDKWPQGPPEGWHDPITDGDLTGRGPGCWVIRAKSKNRPEVVDKNVKAIIDPAEIYAGCYCRASIDLWAYDSQGTSGVSVMLRNVQKLREGDRLGGGSTADQDFDPVYVAGTEYKHEG